MNSLAHALLCLLLLSPSASQPMADVASVNWEEYERVSMIQLIATPQEFDGKKVCVSGFATIQFEGTALFLTRDDVRYLNTKNAVWLELGQEGQRGMDRRYVRVYGVFSAKPKGHRDAYSGTIEPVTRMVRLRALPRGYP